MVRCVLLMPFKKKYGNESTVSITNDAGTWQCHNMNYTIKQGNYAKMIHQNY